VFNFVQTRLRRGAKLTKIDPLSEGDRALFIMHESNPNCHTVPDARKWTQILARYREPSPMRGMVELVLTVGLFVLLWMLMWEALGVSYWLCLVLALPGAGLLVRLFMIQHDCGHGSFFRHRLANDWVGRAIGVLTLTPYDFWRRTHAIHHASSGNLERRGIGDVDTLTVREYLALPSWRRFGYRLYRSPIVMFGLGPAYMFILKHRLPVGMMRAGWQPWGSTMATNVAIVILVGAIMWLVGVGPFLRVHLPVALLAASIGVWLFYFSTSSRILSGPRTGPGASTRRRSTAARITTFRPCCGGSRPTSACTTSITCAAGSHATGCPRFCAITRNSAPSAGSR
jgi:fatty acid desaturase